MGNLSRNGFVLTFAVGVVAASMAFLGGRYLHNRPEEPPEKLIAPDLALDSAGLNKTLPEMVSEGVRLDRTSAGPGQIFNYFHTVLDDDQARIIAADPSRAQQILWQLNERVCAMMPNYVANGVVVKYHLKNRFGADLRSIIVDPRDCGSSPTTK